MKRFCQMVLFSEIVQWCSMGWYIHQNETASPQNSLINKYLWIKLSPIEIVAVPWSMLFPSQNLARWHLDNFRRHLLVLLRAGFCHWPCLNASGAGYPRLGPGEAWWLGYGSFQQNGWSFGFWCAMCIFGSLENQTENRTKSVCGLAF